MNEPSECGKLRAKLASIEKRRRSLGRGTSPLNNPNLPGYNLTDSTKLEKFAGLADEETAIRSRIRELGCSD